MGTHILLFDGEGQEVGVIVVWQQMHQSLPVVDGWGVQQDSHLPHHPVWELQDQRGRGAWGRREEGG